MVIMCPNTLTCGKRYIFLNIVVVLFLELSRKYVMKVVGGKFFLFLENVDGVMMVGMGLAKPPKQSLKSQLEERVNEIENDYQGKLFW